MCKTVDAPTEAEYFYTQFDQYGTDTQVKETVKIEPKLKNVIGSANCQIHLTNFSLWNIILKKINQLNLE